MTTNMLERAKGVDLPVLTPRETEVLKFMALGMKNAEIAKKLTISEHTVKAHVCHILKKFSASDRLVAVVKAIRLGIIE